MILEIDQQENDITISYYDKQGIVKYKNYKTPQRHNWVVCSEHEKRKHPTVKNWDGRSVKHNFAKFYNKYSLLEFVDSLSDQDRGELFSLDMPQLYCVDIETEVSDQGFPDPKLARERITAISIATPDDVIKVYSIKDLSSSDIDDLKISINKHIETLNVEYKFIYTKFDSEYDMLYTYLDEMKKFPSVTGWNFINFDWTYIRNRAINLGIDYTMASPVGKTDGKDEFPMHVGIVDYMELYRKWDRSVSVKENYKLDTAALAVLGVGKIKYSDTIQNMFEVNFKKFILYSSIDSILVREIHKKLRTFDIVITLANICKIPMYKASSPVTITESLICRKFLLEGKVMAIDYANQGGNVKGQYEGAFVKKPLVGRYRGVASFDFASLYPSIMRQFNISPDTYLRKLNIAKPASEEDSYTINLNKKILGEEKSPDKIVSVTGAIYAKEEGIMKRILDEQYGNRKKYKKESFKYKHLLSKIDEEMKKRNIK